jgi:DNA-binding response OmpR family regulator
MPIKVVLAVGLDSWKLTAQSFALRSAGLVFMSAMSIREAIEHFHAGDFDLVLLSDTISMEDKERLTFLIRASGSRTPVVCIAKSPSDSNLFADATLNGDACALLKGMRAALAKTAKALTVSPRGSLAEKVR